MIPISISTWILACVALLIWCFVIFIKAISLAPNLPLAAECGACGHPAAFDGNTCAGCGKDLRDVGTVSARAMLHITPRPATIVVSWTVLFAGCLIALIAIGLRTSIGLAENFDESYTTGRSIDSDMPAISLSHNAVRIGRSLYDWTLILDSAAGNTMTISLDAGDESWTIRDTGEHGTGFNEDTVGRWLTAAGYDIAAAEHTQDIQQIVPLLRHVRDNPLVPYAESLDMQGRAGMFGGSGMRGM
ncbi:MAG: hypothetical protein KC983_12565, partial [Phycisphaerales bacterium]|nr:hypothetical protein [Phycisphaerales bacterium]